MKHKMSQRSQSNTSAYSEDSNDDDLEVATVLAQGLGMSPRRLSQSNADRHSAGRLSGMSPFRASTVMTNVSRGNTATITPHVVPNLTVFHLAAQGELITLREELQDHVINDTDDNGMTMLMWASLHDQSDIVAFLLTGGADGDMQDPAGSTALMFAASNGHERVLEMLVKAKVNVNLKSKDGNSAILFAVHNQNAGCVQLLLEAGADLTVVNGNGCTCLQLASRLQAYSVQCVIEQYIQKLLEPS